MYEIARRERRLTDTPHPGDLAFFDRTYDANGNGVVDDELTHVAIVTHIGSDNTVYMVHWGSGRTRPLRMQLARPTAHLGAGQEVINDFLRSPAYGDATTPRLASELFRGFARPP